MKRVYTEEQRARRNRQWYESRLRCGHATMCPVCGAWTKSRNGFCRRHGGYVRSLNNMRAVSRCMRCGREMDLGAEAKALFQRQDIGLASGYKGDGSVRLCSDCYVEFRKAVDAWLSS